MASKINNYPLVITSHPNSCLKINIEKEFSNEEIANTTIFPLQVFCIYRMLHSSFVKKM